MPAHNAKVMDAHMLAQLNEKFVITYDAAIDYAIVATTNFKKRTLHSCKHPFAINCKKPRRKFTLSVTAMDFWKELLNETKEYSLIDVQNAITILQVTYRDISLDNIKNTIITHRASLKED